MNMIRSINALNAFLFSVYYIYRIYEKTSLCSFQTLIMQVVVWSFLFTIEGQYLSFRHSEGSTLENSFASSSLLNIVWEFYN